MEVTLIDRDELTGGDEWTDGRLDGRIDGWTN